MNNNEIRKQEGNMKYRKKPVEVEAVQLLWKNWSEVCNFVSKDAFGGGCYIDEDGNETENTRGKLGLKIKTLEGIMLATEEDYIIKGVQGEIYPCKPDIFEETYEAVSLEDLGGENTC